MNKEKRVLILFAHPAMQKSRVNRALAEAVMDLPGVTFHDLYEHYPEFDIDVPAEQELLSHHPVIVIQHPILWYSPPAIVKEWEDLVLEHGWAYGSKGTALKGKTLLQAITTGGNAEAYRPEGFNRYTIRELLAPIEQTAHLCGMRYLPPFVVSGTHGMEGEEVQRHALTYRHLIEALRDETADFEELDRVTVMQSPEVL